MDTAIFEIKLRINSNIASTANFTSTRTSWTVICVCSLNSLGKHTGVGCHSLLQGTFPIQGRNPGLLHRRQILYQLSRQGSLGIRCCALARSLCAAQQSLELIHIYDWEAAPFDQHLAPHNNPVPGRHCSALFL